MSESLQTCSITRSSWSSSFCSPDYDETHTHIIKTIKKFSNFSVLNCHPFSVLSQLFFLLGLSFSLPLFFLTEFIFCGHLQSILIFSLLRLQCSFHTTVLFVFLYPNEPLFWDPNRAEVSPALNINTKRTKWNKNLLFLCSFLQRVLITSQGIL